MKGEAIGIFEGAVGLTLVVSAVGRLMEFVIIFGGVLAVTLLVRAVHGLRTQKREETSNEAI